jgi:phosphate transport system substrate-binding protein
MNDEFLYRIRSEPPPDFVKRLKRKLEEQARRLAARWSITRAVFTGLLVGGTAFAAAWWMVGRTPATAMAPGAEQVATTTQPLQSRLRTARVPETSVTGGEPHPELGGGALGTGPLPPDDRVALSKGPGDAQPARSGGVAIGPATTVPGRVVVSAGQLGVRILAVPTTLNLARSLISQSLSGSSPVAPTVEEVDIVSAFDSFCRNEHAPGQIVIASRRIETAESDRCHRNGVTNVLEAKIGYQAVVLAGAKAMPRLALSPQHVFLALARQVPNPTDSTQLVDNPYLTWNEIDWRFDGRRIAISGPKEDATTRKLFVELVMEAGCNSYAWIAALERSDPLRHAEICHTLREDGGYIEAAEVDAVTGPRRLPKAEVLEILSYSYYARHADQGFDNQLRGVAPNMTTIASGEYAASRPVYVYADKPRVDRMPLGRLVLEKYLSERTIGPTGALAHRELIPLDAQELAAQRRREQ